MKNNIYIKYILISISSFLIDIFLFNIFFYLFKDIIISSYLARAISCFINYLLNKYIVFNYQKKGLKSFIQYIILVIINITISAFVVDYLASLLHIKVVFIKMIIDGLLFICNFFIQKSIIFNKNKKETI